MQMEHKLKGKAEPEVQIPQGKTLCQESSPVAIESQQKEATAKSPDTQGCEAAMPVVSPSTGLVEGEAEPMEAECQEEPPTAVTQELEEKAGAPVGFGLQDKKPDETIALEVVAQLPESLQEGTAEEMVPPQPEKGVADVREIPEEQLADLGGESAGILQSQQEKTQNDEDQEETAEALRTIEEVAAAAAALIQASPSPPQLIEAQHTQLEHGGDEPPPPLLTKEALAGPSPTEDEAPPRLSRPSPPSQEPATVASSGVPEDGPSHSPSPLPLPQHQQERPRDESSSSSSSSASSSSRSRSHSRGSSQSRSRPRRPRSGSSESPVRKRRASGSQSRSGSERRMSSRSRSRSRSGSRSRSSSDSSRKVSEVLDTFSSSKNHLEIQLLIWKCSSSESLCPFRIVNLVERESD